MNEDVVWTDLQATTTTPEPAQSRLRNRQDWMPAPLEEN